MKQVTDGQLTRHRLPGQFRLGLRSAATISLAPLGPWSRGLAGKLNEADRREQGLILVFPGIEGRSSINDSIVRGLMAAELPHAVVVRDWRRFRSWCPLHLAMERHNRHQASATAEIVTEYCREFPNRPVHLIGHSAGAGIALFVLQALPDHVMVQATILLAAAVSRDFDAATLSAKTQRGVWNFYSPFDLPAVGLGTLIFGTMDRRHALSAGALGFRRKEQRPADRLFQVKYRSSMIRDWNFGGHFGSTNAAFIRRHVAPLLQ